MSVFTKRLKEARELAALSQERLGVLAGVDEMSASARINQYERGKHQPGLSMIEKLAKVLEVPEAYFYAKDNDVAWLLVKLHRLSIAERQRVIEMVRQSLI